MNAGAKAIGMRIFLGRGFEQGGKRVTGHYDAAYIKAPGTRNIPEGR
jgi:hypothetical protein